MTFRHPASGYVGPTGRLRLCITAAVMFALTSVSSAAGSSLGEPIAPLSRHSFVLSSGSADYAFDYWSNAEIGLAVPTVRRVVVILHGDSRNADDYGRYTASAATTAGVMPSTMIVAPQFIADADSPRDDQLYWTANSWKDGSESEAELRSWTIASFRVMDALLAALRKDYPTADIVLAGHSAGGQFVQRYAASNGVRSANRYVVMNPGSYVYLDNRRWTQESLRPLSAEEIKSCPGYDSYKYGLSGRPASLFAPSTAAVTSSYLASPVTYLLGEADTARDSSLDIGCAAEWEGANRFERGTQFFQALSQLTGAGLTHQLIAVPGVAHEASRMINSSQAALLFFHSEAMGSVSPEAEGATTTSAPTATAPTAAAALASIPSTMRAPRVIRRGRQATVRWKAAVPNGSSITRYRIDISRGTDRSAKASARKAVFNRLQPGCYRVRIAARNDIGAAPFSTWVKFCIR